jgi:very-short-patch-repair endonuclease
LQTPTRAETAHSSNGPDGRSITAAGLFHKFSVSGLARRRSLHPQAMETRLRLAQGHYLDLGPAEQPTFVDRCAALLAANPADTIAVGTTAAALHGLWLPSEPSVPEFATCQHGRLAAAMTRSQRPELRSHRRRIGMADRTMVRGIPVTTLARTWWDLAADLSLPDLVAAGDRALQLGCSIAQIEEQLRSMAHRRGNHAARLAAPLLDRRSKSRPESHLRVAVRAAGLRCFEVNKPVVDEVGEWLAEPDLSCAEAKIALEYQGSDHADVARMRRDITRTTDLRQRGWLVLLYGPAQVFGRPWQIGPELRQLVEQRAPRLLRSSRVGS